MGDAINWMSNIGKSVVPWTTDYAIPWVGGAVGDVTDWVGEQKGWITPALSLAGTMYSQKQQQEAAKKAQRQNLALWQQTAYPRPEAISAAATENRGVLGQARLGSYQNLANQLAARGFGSGSGLGVRGASDIERSYLQTLGKMQTDLTKFAHTPTSGLPAGAYYQPQQTPSGAATNWLTSYLDQARGYNAMRQLITEVYGMGAKKNPNLMTAKELEKYYRDRALGYGGE